MTDDVDYFKQTPALAFDKLSEIGFGLLTSSSMERYIRVAEAAAEELAMAVKSVNGKWSIILDRAKLLWGMSIGSTQREVWEPELAVLVTALIHERSEIPGADDFLTAVGNYQAPATLWVSSLVRHLDISKIEKRRNLYGR